MATLPAKPKHNSGHYSGRLSSSYVSDRTADGICTQKIKPDSLCYNPNHYDNMAGKMQGLNIRQSNGDVDWRRSDHFNPSRNSDRRSLYDNVIEPDIPKRAPERQVSSTKIYLQPTKTDRVSRSYDPSRYSSQEPDLLKQPKVYYQGASDSREQSLRSRSYPHSIESSFSRVPYNTAPANHRPSPPSYNSYQQTKSMIHDAVTSTPWYQEDSYSEQFFDSASSPSNLRAISAKMIPDKLVCERCCQVPISRQQRICAGCEQETYERHKQQPNATDMLY